MKRFILIFCEAFAWIMLLFGFIMLSLFLFNYNAFAGLAVLAATLAVFIALSLTRFE